MNLHRSLIFVTAFSYLGAILSTTLGKPPMNNIGSLTLTPLTQIIGYFILGSTMIHLFINYHNQTFVINTVKATLSAMYGIIAMLSFSGVQTWINYHGVTSLGPYMSLWDLTLAVSIFMSIDETWYRMAVTNLLWDSFHESIYEDNL